MSHPLEEFVSELNLMGLDVLEHFDFALSHRQRTGYLGRVEP